MQFVIWVVIPSLHSSTPSLDTKKALRFVVFFQYLPRLLRLFPLTSKIVNTTGVLMETAWAGAAFNLLLYMLASHVRPSPFTSLHITLPLRSRFL
jgi:cyclic nucleotide gated channel